MWAISGGYGMAMVFCWYLLFALFHAHTLHRQYAQYIHERFALAAAKKSAEDANKAKAEFLAHMKPRAEDANERDFRYDPPSLEQPARRRSVAVPGTGEEFRGNFTENAEWPARFFQDRGWKNGAGKHRVFGAGAGGRNAPLILRRAPAQGP